jgi:hypothetical protein
MNVMYFSPEVMNQMGVKMRKHEQKSGGAC